MIIDLNMVAAHYHHKRMKKMIRIMVEIIMATIVPVPSEDCAEPDTTVVNPQVPDTVVIDNV
jgi:hypothetical protein